MGIPRLQDGELQASIFGWMWAQTTSRLFTGDIPWEVGDVLGLSGKRRGSIKSSSVVSGVHRAAVTVSPNTFGPVWGGLAVLVEGLKRVIVIPTLFVDGGVLSTEAPWSGCNVCRWQGTEA